MWRTVVEMSCMQNNDEHVLYTEEEIKSEQVEKFVQIDRWVSPVLVFSRPVFDEEIEDGLTFATEVFNEKTPDITHFLDAMYKLKMRIVLVKYIKEANNKDWDAIKFIIKDIITQYYDCMSRGLPTYLGSIIKELVECCPGIDLDMPLYPKKYGMHLLKDFLKEVDPPDIKKHLIRIRKQIPSLPTFLLENING